MKLFWYGVLAGAPLGSVLIAIAVDLYFRVGQWLYERKTKRMDSEDEKGTKR